MIKKYRIKYNLTQKEMSKKLGMSERHLRRLENGEILITIKNLNKLIKIFNISDEEILEYIKKQ